MSAVHLYLTRAVCAAVHRPLILISVNNAVVQTNSTVDFNLGHD